MKVVKRYKFPVLKKVRTRNIMYNMINTTYPVVGCMWGCPGGSAVNNSPVMQEPREIRA